jgi:hypothetical protein
MKNEQKFTENQKLMKDFTKNQKYQGTSGTLMKN